MQPSLSTRPASKGHAQKLLDEGLIELSHAAGFFADARGRKPHIATLRRWAKNGCRGHKLETAFLGNRLMTSRQAVTRFIAAINGTDPSPERTNRTTAAETAGLELDKVLK